MRDGQARVEKVHIDLTASQALLTALNSTPSAAARGVPFALDGAAR
jgi:hypothetical protein